VIPLWLKIAYTLFVCLIVPIYWRRYGPANFLWFSNIALLATVPALWLESALLASMMALGGHLAGAGVERRCFRSLDYGRVLDGT